MKGGEKWTDKRKRIAHEMAHEMAHESGWSFHSFLPDLHFPP